MAAFEHARISCQWQGIIQTPIIEFGTESMVISEEMKTPGMKLGNDPCNKFVAASEEEKKNCKDRFKTLPVSCFCIAPERHLRLHAPTHPRHLSLIYSYSGAVLQAKRLVYCNPFRQHTLHQRPRTNLASSLWLPTASSSLERLLDTPPSFRS